MFKIQTLNFISVNVILTSYVPSTSIISNNKIQSQLWNRLILRIKRFSLLPLFSHRCKCHPTRGSTARLVDRLFFNQAIGSPDDFERPTVAGVIKFRIFFKFLRFRSHDLARCRVSSPLRVTQRRVGKEDWNLRGGETRRIRGENARKTRESFVYFAKLEITPCCIW